MKHLRACMLVALLVAPLAGAAPLIVISGPRGGGGGESGGGGGEGVTHGYTITHYADPAASGGGDGSAGDPWTCAEAASNAVAGRVIEFAPGVCNWTNGVGFSPAASGTSGSPIVFVAQYPAVHNLTNEALWTEFTATGTGAQHVVSNDRQVGGNTASRRQYIVFDGFRSYQGAGSVPMVSPPNGTSHHIALHNNTTSGEVFWKIRRWLFDQEDFSGESGSCPDSTPPIGSVAYCGSDNWGAIWTQGSEDVEITDSIFRNFDTTGAGPNLTIWTLYGSLNNRLRYSLAENISSGPYIKGSQTSGWNAPLLVDHNIIKNTRYAFLLPNVTGGESGPGAPFTDVVQNIFIAESGYTYGIRSSGSPTSANPRSARVVNNTFVCKTGCLDLCNEDSNGSHWCWGNMTSGQTQGTDVYHYNNLISVADTQFDKYMGAIQGMDDTGLTRLDSDYNLFPSSFENNFGSGGNVSLASWRSTSGDETNSVFGTPTFVDAANDDYTLQSASDGEDEGLDILDLLGGGTSAAINIGADIGDGDVFGPRDATTLNSIYNTYNWTYPFD